MCTLNGSPCPDPRHHERAESALESLAIGNPTEAQVNTLRELAQREAARPDAGHEIHSSDQVHSSSEQTTPKHTSSR